MRYRLLLILLITATSCLSQDSLPMSRIDTLINFSPKNSIRQFGYNNRMVPFGDNHPLYVQINYEDGKNRNFEYFRRDSSTYLVYEYFRSAKGSSNEGIKSRGVMRVTNEIAGSSTVRVKHLGTVEDNESIALEYYKNLVKEGEWEEFDDSVFHHIYWTGNYTNGRRTGLWKRMVYGIGDEFVLEEIDYSRDSTRKIFSINMIKDVPLDWLKIILIGRWTLRDCDEEKDPRMFYSKCKTYDGAYGDDCNNKWAKENYYDFISFPRFVRQRGEGCYKFRETCTNGQWKITERDGNRFIEIKFTNGQTWKLKILYLDHDNNLVTDRQ